MKFSIFLSALTLAALSRATILKPAAGDTWVAGEKTSIAWDKDDFRDQVDIALVPAGATDTSVVLSQIATETDNTGSMTWTLPATVGAGTASVIIKNSGSKASSKSSKSSSKSSAVIIIINNGNNNNGGSSGSANNTEAVNSMLTTIQQTVTSTSSVQLAGNTTTATVQIITGTAQTSAPAATDQAGAPYGNATDAASALPASTTLASQGGSASGTGAAPASPVFTGGASAFEMTSVASSGFAVFVAMLFL